MENLQRKLQDEITKVMEEIDFHYVRPLQKEGMQCALNCFDSLPDAPQKSLQQCHMNCMKKPEMCQQIFEREMGQFQQGVSGCVQNCQNEIMSGSSQSSDQGKMQAEMTQCASKCVDKYIEKIPNLKERITQGIQSMK